MGDCGDVGGRDRPGKLTDHLSRLILSGNRTTPPAGKTREGINLCFHLNHGNSD